jgi:hypothetical protein
MAAFMGNNANWAATTPRDYDTEALKKMLDVLSTEQVGQLADLVGSLALMQAPDFDEASRVLAASLSDAQQASIKAVRTVADARVAKIYDARRHAPSPHGVYVVNLTAGPDKTDNRAAMILLGSAIDQLMSAVTEFEYSPPSK